MAVQNSAELKSYIAIDLYTLHMSLNIKHQSSWKLMYMYLKSQCDTS